MKQLLGVLLLWPIATFAGPLGIADPEIISSDFQTTEQILHRDADNTECATAAFANALATGVSAVSETDHETVIQQWVYETFARPDVLTRVLACPEIADAPDDKTIKFLPIEYTFPGGRRIVINYETQPRVLKQRLKLTGKRMVGNPDNPAIGLDDGNVWTNTDPAWYAIMVVEHGALANFVGPDKNNTVSLSYIADNIDDLYPADHGVRDCTSRSGSEMIGGNDSDIINISTHKTVDVDDDPNDYYVAGDVNLQWVTYLEVGLDVLLTVATVGGWAVVSGGLKGARAVRAMRGLTNTIKTLSKTEAVSKYIAAGAKYSRAAKNITKTEEALKAARTAKNADRVRDLEREIKAGREELKTMEQGLKEMEKIDDVAKYRKAAASFSELNRFRHALKGLRSVHAAQRGNVIARSWRVTRAAGRAFRAANTGNKIIKRGAKIARSSMKSGRVRDWLYHSTLRNAGTLAKLGEAGGFLYGALHFLGDMYDWTETSTDEYTSGLEFAPLLLLSADDLEGQENVVNYGMWLLWAGDSVSAADDDAAYLQALDFAEKFSQDLNDTMDELNDYACDIDIYVARPVLQNPGTNDAAIFYLIMNDEPWTTHLEQ